MNSYSLLYQIAQNTAGVPPRVGDGVHALAYKIAQNTAAAPPKFGEDLYDLFYRIAVNTAGTPPQSGDGIYDLLYKIAGNTGGNPKFGDGVNSLLAKTAGGTAGGGGGGGPSLDSDAVTQQARIVADGGTVTDINFLSGLITDLKSAGCYALLDALYIPVACKKDGGNRVSKLYDLSLPKTGSVYYDAVQNTAASQQLWEANKVDGKPWVTFDPLRVGGYLSAPVVPYTGYPSTYFVVSRAVANDNHKAIFGRMSNADRLDVVNYFGTFVGIVLWVGGTSVNVITDPLTLGQFTCLFNGSTSTCRRKGTQIGSGDTGTISLLSNLQFGIGDYRTFWPLDGSVAFAAACCRAITIQQRDAIENLLNTKYYPSTVA